MEIKPDPLVIGGKFPNGTKGLYDGQRVANYDRWFCAMAREGIEAADHGDFVSEDEVARRFAAMLTTKVSKVATG